MWMFGFKGFIFLPKCIYAEPILLLRPDGYVTREMVNNASIISHDKKPDDPSTLTNQKHREIDKRTFSFNTKLFE
jgi:hypothetical protein